MSFKRWTDVATQSAYLSSSTNSPDSVRSPPSGRMSAQAAS
jgi:hypothetical protein